MEESYEVVIIGAGMMGSSAFYHCSVGEGVKSCLIGPDEPKNRNDSEIFGCWFDEGRICRRIDMNETWSILAVESILKYRELEKLSGINFYNEVGFIYVIGDKMCEQLMKMKEETDLEGCEISKEWKEMFPFLSFTSDLHVLLERHRFAVKTKTGECIQTKNIIIAAGNYGAFPSVFKNVFPDKVPDLDLRTQTIAFLKISEKEAQRLREMPSMITSYKIGNLDGTYILPPIKYPDENWYIKLGHSRHYEESVTSLPELMNWYRLQSGNPECVQELTNAMKTIIPDLKIESASGDGCCTSHSPNGHPYIDIAAPGVGIALAGNGCAAKSCYEIGRLVVRLLLHNKWESAIAQDTVKVVWKRTTPDD